ncbi:tricarboxylate transport membrane protein TctA [Psychrobacter sp. JCM 18901]|nr:tricarboxylate transport membrane protein TctA [Psychrobacter sp. JCM 18901]
METFDFLMQGFGVAMLPKNLLIALIGAFIGTVVGMLPGLGPINGVAILLPFAFALGLPPESALILLAAVYLGCEYGGRISAILLNVPGSAAAVMTSLDGNPLAVQAKPASPYPSLRSPRLLVLRLRLLVWSYSRLYWLNGRCLLDLLNTSY